MNAAARPARLRAVPRRPGVAVTVLVLLLHVWALWVLGRALQPPSLLQQVAPPMYTRTLRPTAAAPAPPPAAPALPPPRAKPRPTATLKIARPKPAKARAAPANDAGVTAQAAADAAAAESQDPAATPEPPQAAASAPVPTPAPLEQANTASPPAPGGSSGAVAAAAPEPTANRPGSGGTAHLESWPGDTRLTYRLGGYYRGDLSGNAAVLWQRTGERYQSVVQLDVGFLLNSRFSSQGVITPQGLRPDVYEEQVRGKRRGVRVDDDGVRLDNGERVPRPQDVQDTASQFVELGHRFATGKVPLTPGSQVNFWLARPGGVDEWTYDVMAEETVHLPRLGAVRALHLKPRPLAKPRGPITAEMWFAPSLQYLPVRIRLTSGPDTFIDLLVETIEQK